MAEENGGTYAVVQETNGVGETKDASNDLLFAQLFNHHIERPHTLSDEYALAVHGVGQLTFFSVEVFDYIGVSKSFEHLKRGEYRNKQA